MTMKLYEKHNYTNRDIVYLKNNIVREYDMVNAGINILKHNKILTENEVNKLNKLEKLERNIIVGKFLKKNKDINEFLIEEFINIRKQLFLENSIINDEVLSIKKDAIFLINKELKTTQLNEDYIFKEKNKYFGYININRKEFYYNSNKIDIKGFSKNVKQHHKDYLFKFLYELLLLDINNRKDDLFEQLIQFKYNFIDRSLPKEYYYDIYKENYLFELCNIILSRNKITDEMKRYCLINNNLNFIISIINILL